MSIPLGHLIQFDRPDLLDYRDASRSHREFDLKVDDPIFASAFMGRSPDPLHPRTVLECSIDSPGSSGTDTEAGVWANMRTAHHGGNPSDDAGATDELVVALKVRYSTADGSDWLTPDRMLEMVQIDTDGATKLATIGLMGDGVHGARLTIALGNEALRSVPLGVSRLTRDTWHTIAIHYKADSDNGFCWVSVDGLVAAFRVHANEAPVGRVEIAKIMLRGGNVAPSHYPMRFHFEYAGLLRASEFAGVYGSDDRRLDIPYPLAGFGFGSIRQTQAVVCFAEEGGHFNHAWASSDLDWFVEYADNPEFTNALSSGSSTALLRDRWWDFIALSGLDPDTTYFYRTVVTRAGVPSTPVMTPVRRLQTLPMEGTATVGFAMCHDQSTGQPFKIYGHLGDRGITCAIGLGDFIYNDSQASPNTGPHAEVEGFLREYKLAFDLEAIRYMHQGHLIPAIPSDHDWEDAIHRNGGGAYSRGYGPNGVRTEFADNTIAGRDGTGYTDDPCQNFFLNERGVARRTLWDAAREAMYKARARGLLGATRMAHTPPANPWEDTEYFEAFDVGVAHFVLIDSRSFQDFNPAGAEWFNDTGEACFLGRHMENLLKAHLRTVSKDLIVLCLDPVWGDVYAGVDNPHSFAQPQRNALERWLDENLATQTRVVIVCGDRHVRYAHHRFRAGQSGRSRTFRKGLLEVDFGQSSMVMFTVENNIIDDVLFDDQDGMTPGDGQWARFGGVLTVTPTIVWAEFIGPDGDNQGVVARRYSPRATSYR